MKEAINQAFFKVGLFILGCIAWVVFFYAVLAPFR